MDKTIWIRLFLVLLSLLLLGLYMAKKYMHKQLYGTVVILNGPSSAGKSSIQKSFQKIMMPNLWVKLGIDNLFDSPMPDITVENMSFWQSKNSIRWVESTKDTSENSIVTLFVGEQGNKVAYAMNSAILEYAKNGCNVIVDYIAYNQAWLADLKEKLKETQTYYIKVTIPLETLERREEARGTSPKGHARSHYHMVYGDIKYDLEVDSEKQTADEIAQSIKNILKDNNAL